MVRMLAKKAVSCAGLTRASIRRYRKNQSYDLHLRHALMDPRVKPGGDTELVDRTAKDSSRKSARRNERRPDRTHRTIGIGLHRPRRFGGGGVFRCRSNRRPRSGKAP